MSDNGGYTLESNVNVAFSDENLSEKKKVESVATRNDIPLKSTVVSVAPNDALADSANKTDQVNATGCTTCQSILTVALVVVLIAFAVILVLFIKEKRDSGDSDSTATVVTTVKPLVTATVVTTVKPLVTATVVTTVKPLVTATVVTTVKPPVTCFDEKCIASAAELLSHMNRSVDPCQDFYSFACGGWEEKTLIPPTGTQINVLLELAIKNREFMRNHFGNPATRLKYAKNRAVIKSIDFYQTCLSRLTVNEQGDTYLKDVIESVGGSNLSTADWNSTKYDLDKAIQISFGQLAVQPFFALGVYADFINSSIRRFAILEGGLKLANTFYVTKNSSEVFYSKTREAYKEYMVDVMTLLGADPQEAQRQMLEVYLFEEKMAEIVKETQGQPTTATIEKLSQYTNYDWFSFFTELTANQSYELTVNETILFKNQDILKGVMGLINNTDKAILSNYIAWIIIEKVIDHLPDKYGNARLAYNKKILGSTYEEQERWITCYKATKTAFPMPLGLIFVDAKLSSEARGRAAEIFEEIKSEFIRELSNQTWMDEDTKIRAKAKAEAMTVVVGYPDYIKDEEKLNEKYIKVQVDKNNYLQTVFNIRKFSFQAKVADLRRPVNRKIFEESPAELNALHYYQENKNIFLAGILLPPLYDEHKFRASNYGGIGMIAGHELTHGFDSTGRSYDNYGNRANWWSGNSSVEYFKKTKCLEEQYSEFELYGKKVNGKLTIAETTADNGGIKFAFKAYQRWEEKHGKESRLPGVDFTPYQLFFVSYAQAWCAKYTRQGALDQLDNKPWPPQNIRIEGVIKNSREFAEAFNCTSGRPMNPVKKCSVW